MPLDYLNAVEEEALRRLLEAAVEFVVVGGHAVLHYTPAQRANGVWRTIGDLDLFVAADHLNIQRLKVALTDQAWVNAGDIGVFEQLNSGATINLLRYRVQFLPKLTGVTWEEVWREKEQVFSGAGNLAVISLPLLIKNKRAAGRPKDLEDAIALEAV